MARVKELRNSGREGLTVLRDRKSNAKLRTVFTDGSGLRDKRTGSGVAMNRRHGESWPVRYKSENYNAELEAIEWAMTIRVL